MVSFNLKFIKIRLLKGKWQGKFGERCANHGNYLAACYTHKKRKHVSSKTACNAGSIPPSFAVLTWFLASASFIL